jgi:hypothetical protein
LHQTASREGVAAGFTHVQAGLVARALAEKRKDVDRRLNAFKTAYKDASSELEEISKRSAKAKRVASTAGR